MSAAVLDDLLRAKIELAGAPKETSDVLAILVRSQLNVSDDGSVKVVDGNGHVRVGGGPHYGDMSLDELVAEMAASKPSLFGKAPKNEPDTPMAPAPTPPPAGEVATARAIRESRERRERNAAAKAAAEATAPNPWKQGSINKTQQVLLTARDPQRAARLQAEAAAVPTYIIKH